MPPEIAGGGSALMPRSKRRADAGSARKFRSAGRPLRILEHGVLAGLRAILALLHAREFRSRRRPRRAHWPAGARWDAGTCAPAALAGRSNARRRTLACTIISELAPMSKKLSSTPTSPPPPINSCSTLSTARSTSFFGGSVGHENGAGACGLGQGAAIDLAVWTAGPRGSQE